MVPWSPRRRAMFAAESTASIWKAARSAVRVNALTRQLGRRHDAVLDDMWDHPVNPGRIC